METAIGHSGYCWPFSQVNTISEQLPIDAGPDVRMPRSAADAGTGLRLARNPTEIAVITSRPKMARMVAPKAEISSQEESKEPLHRQLVLGRQTSPPGVGMI